MAYPAKDYFLLQGRRISTPPSQGAYTRLLVTGTETGSKSRFVEFLTATASEQFGTSDLAQFIVPTISQLYFSDFSAPPPSTGAPQPPTRPVRAPGLPGVAVPPPTQFVGSDGMVLAVITTSGQVSKLTGTSESNVAYGLSLQTSVGKGVGRHGTQATWAAARISVTKNGDSGLVCSVGYCPTDDFAGISLSYGNVETGIAIDFSPLTLKPDGSVTGDAVITRGINYYEVSCSSQVESVAADATDPAVYMPAVSTLWPYLDRIEYFAPALELLASRTASQLPSLPRPLAPLAAMQAYALTPKIALTDYVARMTAWICPALGPLAAEFVSPSEYPVSGLKDACLWLGWALTFGPGKTAFDAALAAAYDAYQLVVAEGGGGGAPGIRILPVRPVSADLTLFQRAMAVLFPNIP